MKILTFVLVLICHSLLLLTTPVSAQDQANIKEPETPDQFFFLDSVGDIRSLEQQTPKGQELVGNRSPIRFVQGEPLAFVVRLSSQDGNPATIVHFSQLNARGKNRVLGTITGAVPFEATKYGEYSLKIKSKANLEPGEYALRLSTKKDGYSFGVDAVKKNLR